MVQRGRTGINDEVPSIEVTTVHKTNLTLNNGEKLARRSVHAGVTRDKQLNAGVVHETGVRVGASTRTMLGTKIMTSGARFACKDSQATTVRGIKRRTMHWWCVI